MRPAISVFCDYEPECHKVVESHIIQLLQDELSGYFDGTVKIFTIPLAITGSKFQVLSWRELGNIPYGKTISYADQAKNIGHTGAFRAIGSANAANKICILVPCHRVIRSNGSLGGYSGEIFRKEWLINHEKSMARNG